MCEEPNCLAQRFVVFRTALDLKAHDVCPPRVSKYFLSPDFSISQVTTHLADRNLSRSEARAARTLDAAVLFGDPRPRREAEDRTGHRKGRRRDEPFVFSPNLSTTTTTTTTSRNTLPSRTANATSAASGKSKGGKKEKKSGASSTTDDSAVEEKSSSQPSEQGNLANLHSQVPMLFLLCALNFWILQNQVEKQMQQAAIPKEERQIRNKILIEKINTFLGPERFDEFKKLSAELRLAHITPAQYYQRFMNSFGWMKASELFPELVDLLPDPHLRAALLTLHKAANVST